MKVDQQLQQIISRIIAEYDTEPQAEAVSLLSVSAVLEKARRAHKNLVKLTLKQREEIIQSVRSEMTTSAALLLQGLLDLTRMGNLDDKLINLDLIIRSTPALDDLKATVNTGDDGLTLNEYSPYGVIASVVPINNLVEVMVCQTIGMIAAGNAVVFTVSECVYKAAQSVVSTLNGAITRLGGPEHLLTVLTDVQAPELVAHPIVDMVVLTGQVNHELHVLLTKKTIITGQAHAPVIVDETANIEQAAKDIVAGASFDHNQLFIAEKAIVAVDAVADFLLHHLRAAGTYVVTQPSMLQRLESLLLESKDGHSAYKGRAASDILYLLGIYDQPDARVIVVETDNINHPFICNDMMAPILPLVRAKDIDSAIELALEIEGGNKHTAIMHSKHIDHLTACARALQVVLFVKNAPSFAGIGLKGEGFTSFTVAALTGEGPISARHYSRSRRCVLSEGFLIK